MRGLVSLALAVALPALIRQRSAPADSRSHYIFNDYYYFIYFTRARLNFAAAD